MKHKSVTALDDRVARMSDLRTLVDEVSKLIALQQIQIDEIKAVITPPTGFPPGDVLTLTNSDEPAV